MQTSRSRDLTFLWDVKTEDQVVLPDCVDCLKDVPKLVVDSTGLAKVVWKWAWLGDHSPVLPQKAAT